MEPGMTIANARNPIFRRRLSLPRLVMPALRGTSAVFSSPAAVPKFTPRREGGCLCLFGVRYMRDCPPLPAGRSPKGRGGRLCSCACWPAMSSGTCAGHGGRRPSPMPNWPATGAFAGGPEKARAGQLADGSPAHCFETLMASLETITENRCRLFWLRRGRKPARPRRREPRNLPEPADSGGKSGRKKL